MLFLLVDLVKNFLNHMSENNKKFQLDYVVISIKYVISCIIVQIDTIFIFWYIEMNLF